MLKYTAGVPWGAKEMDIIRVLPHAQQDWVGLARQRHCNMEMIERSHTMLAIAQEVAEVANHRGEPAEAVYFNQFYAAVLDLEEQLAETFDRMWGFVELADLLPWAVPMEFD